jgi:hypothetical protein
MVQQISTTGTALDVPVVPDARIRYEPLLPARPLSIYTVPAREPAAREDDR